MATISNLLATQNDPASGLPTPPAKSKGVADKDQFLQLLVAQIKNQNPLSPADGVEFLTQLSQFTGVEQMISMKEEIAGLRADLKAALIDPADSAEKVS